MLQYYHSIAPLQAVSILCGAFGISSIGDRKKVEEKYIAE